VEVPRVELGSVEPSRWTRYKFSLFSIKLKCR